MYIFVAYMSQFYEIEEYQREATHFSATYFSISEKQQLGV
jgi:hypothetical protein